MIGFAVSMVTGISALPGLAEPLALAAAVAPGRFYDRDMPRTRDQRLRLFDRHVTSLIAESGSHATWGVTWEAEGVTMTESGRESLRSWLLAVRALDAPSEDV